MSACTGGEGGVGGAREWTGGETRAHTSWPGEKRVTITTLTQPSWKRNTTMKTQIFNRLKKTHTKFHVRVSVYLEMFKLGDY